MSSFWRIFSLESTSLIRSGTFALLAATGVLWTVLSPLLLEGDGTAEGARELYVRYSIGGVFALLLVALVSSATGALARERAAKRLQLTMVRPVRYFTIAAAKIAAISCVGAVVLALSMALAILKTGTGNECNHVLRPLMPSPREEALAMYEHFMASDETPIQVKRTKKEIVLRLLENRARDNYQTIATNSTAQWTFDLKEELDSPKVRFKFSTDFNQRQNVSGRVSIGRWSSSVSNITQTVVTVPLVYGEGKDDAVMRFSNGADGFVMLRPRRDIALLVPADSFLMNLFRAYLELVAILTLVVSFGVFLGSCLSRPVALFTAIVVLIVSEISPSVVEQYPDQLETDKVDRIALSFTRFASAATRPVSSLSPLQSLSQDECVEVGEVVFVVAINMFLLPAAMALFSAFFVPRKQDES